MFIKLKTSHPVKQVVTKEDYELILSNPCHPEHCNLVHETVGDHHVYYIKHPDCVKLHSLFNNIKINQL